MFPTLTELSADTGPLGYHLRLLPSWAISAADKWAKQTDDQQLDREGPDRSWPDPWQFLIDALTRGTLLSDATNKQRAIRIFRSAQSQLIAMKNLLGLALGRASRNTNWLEEALKAEAAGKTRRAEYAKNKNANAMIKFTEVQNYMSGMPELSESWTAYIKAKRAKHPIRQKRLPTWETVRSKFQFETMLVEWWVRPGLMFFRNEALTDLLFELSMEAQSPDYRIKDQTLSGECVKTLRQRLGLIPVGDKNHVVWNVCVSHNTKHIEIRCFSRNGETVWNNKIARPDSPH